MELHLVQLVPLVASKNRRHAVAPGTVTKGVGAVVPVVEGELVPESVQIVYPTLQVAVPVVHDGILMHPPRVFLKFGFCEISKDVKPENPPTMDSSSAPGTFTPERPLFRS